MTTLRGAAFWAVDGLRGGRVRAHLDDVSALMEDLDGGARRRRLLTAQLDHAAARVRYYRDLGRGAGLSEFPVVNKAIVRNNAEQMIADGIDRSKLHVASTSGSTGTPFRVFHDARKRRRVSAETFYWGALAGYEFGIPLYHLKIWTDRNRIGHVSQLLGNIVPVDVTSMSSSEMVAMLARAGEKNKRVSVISYSSALGDIAREVRGKELSLPRQTIASIIGQSEALAPSVRAGLAEAFGCEPVARYGLEELGVLGQQLRNGQDDYLINRATQFVEILNEDSDTLAAPGEVGRIVVTELFNRAQPMIRYDTGDLGAFALSDDGEVDERRFARVEGRKLDRIFDVDDRPLSSMVMYQVWWRYPEINQYQLVQRKRADYLLRLNVDEEFIRTDELVTDLRQYLGSDAKVAVERTNEQFILASGKRQSVISHYQPELNR